MYKKYLTVPCAISMEEAVRCFDEIQHAVSETKDELLDEVYNDFVASCIRYAHIRAEWAILTREDQMEKDSSRTSAHNRVIDTHNILARYMSKIGLSAEWHTVLGYNPEERMTRKRLGDFACYVALFLGLESR